MHKPLIRKSLEHKPAVVIHVITIRPVDQDFPGSANRRSRHHDGLRNLFPNATFPACSLPILADPHGSRTSRPPAGFRLDYRGQAWNEPLLCPGPRALPIATTCHRPPEPRPHDRGSLPAIHSRHTVPRGFGSTGTRLKHPVQTDTIPGRRCGSQPAAGIAPCPTNAPTRQT